MPFIVVNPDSPRDIGGIADKTYEYAYPDKLDLKPGSELHQFLVGRLIRYALESNRLMSLKRRTWNKIDDKLTGFIKSDDAERKVKRDDERRPISIVFPYSYAILETLVSYLIAGFTVDPMFRYEGTGPEDVAGAILMEKVIATHCIRNKVALNLHTMFRDACAYSFGATSPQWMQKHGSKTIKQPIQSYGMNGELTTNGFKRIKQDAVLFEGNELVNIDPYCYLPDPSVPIHDVQKGEYVGWMDRTNMMNLLEQEEWDDDLFNVKYLYHMTGKATSVLGIQKQNRTRYQGSQYDPSRDRMISDPVDLFNMYVKLIPSQWKLGTGKSPEKWMFTLASDAIVIRAKPLGLDHNMFPVSVCAPDFDGYSPVTHSRIEILGGMQETIDWLFNSHIANVRKAINDVLVVDPFLININDLKNPGPGGLVRLRRPAWGKQQLDQAVKQLNVVDITKQNIQEVAAIIQYMQTIGGTDNPVMGNLRQGGPERLSAREFQGTTQGAVNRLERVAKVIGLQAMQDIGYMFAYHTQQLMEKDLWVRTVGEWPQEVMSEFGQQMASGRIKVSPDDLLVDYDLLVRDGSIPGGNFSDVWTQLFQTIGNSELLVQRFDVVRIFKYIATQLGAKNVEDFALRPQQPVQMMTAPDEQVEQGVQNGDLQAILAEVGA